MDDAGRSVSQTAVSPNTGGGAWTAVHTPPLAPVPPRLNE